METIVWQDNQEVVKTTQSQSQSPGKTTGQIALRSGYVAKVCLFCLLHQPVHYLMKIQTKLILQVKELLFYASQAVASKGPTTYGNKWRINVFASSSLPARASDPLATLQDDPAGLSAPQACLLAQITYLTDPVSRSSDFGWPLRPSDQPNTLILFSQALWLASRHSDQPLAFCLALLPLS